jgi:hypothetical protein
MHFLTSEYNFQLEIKIHVSAVLTGLVFLVIYYNYEICYYRNVTPVLVGSQGLVYN